MGHDISGAGYNANSNACMTNALGAFDKALSKYFGMFDTVHGRLEASSGIAKKGYSALETSIELLLPLARMYNLIRLCRKA